MGQKHLIGTGDFTWDSVERRSDRYGTVRLTHNDKEGEEHNVLFDPALDALEGKKGRLYAEVLKPVRSPHMGDLARGIRPTTPDKGEIVVFGEGELFIEHRGRTKHEQSQVEREDDEMFDAINNEITAAFAKLGAKVVYKNPAPPQAEPEEVYDLVGLKPDDGRNTDWLNPRSFYRVHLSQVNIWFEELP